jgi:hypothetical protein
LLATIRFVYAEEEVLFRLIETNDEDLLSVASKSFELAGVSMVNNMRETRAAKTLFFAM